MNLSFISSQRLSSESVTEIYIGCFPDVDEITNRMNFIFELMILKETNQSKHVKLDYNLVFF